MIGPAVIASAVIFTVYVFYSQRAWIRFLQLFFAIILLVTWFQTLKNEICYEMHLLVIGNFLLALTMFLALVPKFNKKFMWTTYLVIVLVIVVSGQNHLASAHRECSWDDILGT